MEIDPNEITKWGLGGITALIGTVWGFLKSDIGRAHKNNEKLFENAEADRKEYRDLFRQQREIISDAVSEVNKTVQLNQHEVLQAIADIKRSCTK